MTYRENEDDGAVESSSSNNNRPRWPDRPWGNPAFRQGVHTRRFQWAQRGFLRPQILHLLGEKPMNGVDIMNKMQEMSRGWYRPSPGSIYPLLEQLEKEGLLAKNKDGKYELTARYHEETSSSATQTLDIGTTLTAMESNTSYLEDLQSGNIDILSKQKDRIERLARRLDALRVSPTKTEKNGEGEEEEHREEL